MPRALPLLAAALLLALPGCGRRAEPPRTLTWVAARPEPAFDPDGAPDPLRHALEAQLTSGLLRRDGDGVVPDAAEGFSFSADSLTLTFRLGPGLRFTDGTPCRSSHFARAMRAGLGRGDHGTRGFELAGLRGVDAVRAGRPLPPLGIETPDSLTLVLRLTRRLPDLLDRLARPGVADAWLRRDGGWETAVGLGPMRVVARGPGATLVLAPARPGGALPDTLAVRFVPGEGRVRAALRAGAADLVWPLPPAFTDQPLPEGFEVGRRASDRQLALVLRADLPPTTRLAARRALAHGLNRAAVLRGLGRSALPPAPLVPGGPAFEAPGFDLRAMRQFMEQARLGRSFHVTLAYDADGPGAAIARSFQGELARGDVYVELMPRRGAAWTAEALGGRRSQLLLVEHAPLVPGVAGAIAPFVMPLRGPAVGGFRAGWRTREFDRWLTGEGRGEAPPAPAVRLRLEQELVALPLATLPVEWVERTGPKPWRFGPWAGPRFGEVRIRQNP